MLHGVSYKPHNNVKRAIKITLHPAITSSLSGLTTDRLSHANTWLGIILNLYLAAQLQQRRERIMTKGLSTESLWLPRSKPETTSLHC